MKWYIKCLKQYAKFSGRARRKEYWMFVLFDAVFLIIAILIENHILESNFGKSIYGSVPLTYFLGTLLPRLAVSVRRLHDIGKKGWNIFIIFIPIIGYPIFLAYMMADGSPENEYGENPKGD
ncbi:MAG: DUF805 domain-containing protein [Bacteroidales bacterium]|jgi:uncharacterized membrane protein YhaH (DUF805 family)|nr:DUF805 domain-containing protein [Bacteroidales bacterium]